MSEKKNVAPVQPGETEAKKLAEQKEKTVIWLGPAIAGVAMTGTVYQNGLTAQVEKMKTELPACTKLLVETKDAARVRKALTDPQSAESLCYEKVLAYAGKGAKE